MPRLEYTSTRLELKQVKLQLMRFVDLQSSCLQHTVPNHIPQGQVIWKPSIHSMLWGRRGISKHGDISKWLDSYIIQWSDPQP